ncbi:MAG: hypothetical protein M1837_003952 [Sclerophora amabilis]|nr:MAG: hypothetical protein M1837_003952 [Sclerophora amabilis]
MKSLLFVHISVLILVGTSAGSLINLEDRGVLRSASSTDAETLRPSQTVFVDSSEPDPAITGAPARQGRVWTYEGDVEEPWTDWDEFVSDVDDEYIWVPTEKITTALWSEAARWIDQLDFRTPSIAIQLGTDQTVLTYPDLRIAVHWYNEAPENYEGARFLTRRVAPLPFPGDLLEPPLTPISTFLRIKGERGEQEAYLISADKHRLFRIVIKIVSDPDFKGNFEATWMAKEVARERQRERMSALISAHANWRPPTQTVPLEATPGPVNPSAGWESQREGSSPKEDKGSSRNP